MMPQKGGAAESATAAEGAAAAGAVEGAADGAEKAGLSAGKRRRTDTTALDEPRRLRVVGNFDDVCKIEWPEVAKLMANLRNEHQCREKWFESIDPAVNRLSWTDEEDQELLRGELSWLDFCLSVEGVGLVGAGRPGCTRWLKESCTRSCAVGVPRA